MIVRRSILVAALVLSACGSAVAASAPEGYQLQQILILSRHNLRAPLANNGSLLSKITDRTWPQWEVPGGNLTVKGGVLETYMGRYAGGWLAQQGLLAKDACPTQGSVYTYANSLQRTVATAQFFLVGAFPGCDIAVHHQDKMGTMDPTFSPSFTSGDPGFTQAALAAMNAKAKVLRLSPGYHVLARILAYRQSQSCQVGKLCDLPKAADSFTAKQGEEPGTDGPLKIGNSAIDAFTLQYYEGFPSRDVAWGKIHSERTWKALASIKNAYQDTLFTAPVVARNVAAPLRAYINGAFVTPDATAAPKVTLMFGHDSNIASLLASLGCEPYRLPGQDEKTPIGGNLQFQRWHNAKTNQDLFKLDYVYQTKQQLRAGTKLSAGTPPYRVTLSLKGCTPDNQGFCDWKDFAKVMQQ